MNVTFADFCGFGQSGKDTEWRQLRNLLRRLSVYLKQSDQAGKVGSLIFDPVGTNRAIKSGLKRLGWETNVPIPKQHSALGTDVDYGINGVLAEGQFSNYPFFLNNVFRTNFFCKKGVVFDGIGRVDASIIITKVRALPASNSTLYYEQALDQMRFMLEAEALATPTRLIGLAVDVGTPFSAKLSTYKERRYSRTVVRRTAVRCELHKGPRSNSRCRIVTL